MMQVRHWVLLSLASLILVGYAGKATKTQATENTMPVIINTSAQLTHSGFIAQAMNSTKPAVVSSGSFASGEHSTQGTARIIAQSGKFFLELDQGFKTSSKGPDLVVLLHRSSNVLGSTKPPSYPLKSGDYVFLASLRNFSGAQRYAIPETVNLASYKSAVIWCRKFNATFGAANLISR